MFGPDAAIDAYLDHLRVERGLSRNTLSAYGRDLSEFAAFVQAQGITTAKDIRLETVGDWLCELKRSGVSSRSSARKLSAIRGLLRFLVREGELSEDPSALIERPRFGRRLPRPLSVDQVVQLICAPDRATLRGLRDRALLSLAYAAGLRVSELLSLRLSDIDFQRGVAQVLGKGRKRRLVPLGTAALQDVSAYLARRGREAQEVGTKQNTAVFTTSKGKQLTRQAFWKIVSRAALKVGLGEHVHPHRLRHSFATHLLSGGADLRAVQTLLGHADIATTEVYTLVTKEALRSIHARSHPRG